MMIASGAAALDFWMTNDELRRAFAGVTIAGHYTDGRTFRESYFKGHRLKYTEETRDLHQVGHWSIINGTFCTIYDLSPTGGCFRVHRHGGNCFEFYFLTRTEAQARQSKTGEPSWAARAWRVDQPATCDEKPVA